MRLAACGVVGKLIALLKKRLSSADSLFFLYPHWGKTENFYKKYTYIW